MTDTFAARLRDELGAETTAPFSGTSFDLMTGAFIYEAPGIRLEKEKMPSSPKAQKAARAFQKLLSVGQRLISVIRKNEGIPNKDLDKFAREIQSLCDKWDRTDL